jgi:hypothetical protein
MAIRRTIAEFSDDIATADIADDAITGAKLANNIAISTSGAITTTGAFTSVGIDDNADATAITIDSSERVGIGVTPESWGAGYSALQIGGMGSLAEETSATAGSSFLIANNMYNDGSYKRIIADETSLYRQNNGVHHFRVAGSDSADSVITWTNAMIIDNSGNVGIGTTAPQGIFHVKSANPIVWIQDSETYGPSAVAELRFAEVLSGSTIDNWVGLGMEALNLQFYTGTAGNTASGGGNTRMVIEGSGNVIIGNSGSWAAGSNVCLIESSGVIDISRTGTGSNTNLAFYNGNGGVGSITTSGSTTSFNTSSDYRLKENVVPMSGSIDRLKALKPSKFNFIADADKTVDGFLAHEAQEVVPESVLGTKDGMTEAVLYVEGNKLPEGKSIGDVKTAETIDPQGIDQSKLVPLLVGALQEVITRIEALEAT